MAVDEKHVRVAPETGAATGLGLIKGLGVTLKHLLRRSVTVQYPEVRPDLPARTRGVIALKQENCTVCYKCSRECPDWCIYIDAHKETHPPASGGKARSVKVLDRFAIDFALCMYCGICVEVCPFDALFWSPEFEYSEYAIAELLHEKEKLEEWTYTVLPPPELEDGAEVPAEVAEAAASAGLPAPVAAVIPAAAVGAEPTAPPAAAPVAAPAPIVAPAPVAEPAAASGPPPMAAEAVERKEVALDQETFDRVLAELVAKGTSQRVAEGQARRAAMIAARQKAAEAPEVPEVPEAPEPEVVAEAPAAEAAAPAEETAPPLPPGFEPVAEMPIERKEVALDQETFDRVLAELLEKGTTRRVAEGQARRAAMIAARKKAAEGGS
jgi:formate hydrogenlyase subunit 6/NADH:ubiquinone oxidoreductase subunit I